MSQFNIIQYEDDKNDPFDFNFYPFNSRNQ